MPGPGESTSFPWGIEGNHIRIAIFESFLR